MGYQLQLNLEEREALSAIISFWKKKNVQGLLAAVFNAEFECFVLKVKFSMPIFFSPTFPELLQNFWIKKVETVVNHFCEDLFIQNIKVEFDYLLKITSERIFSWYHYIKHEYKVKEDAINCINKIHWTHYGTVDVVETFQSSWLNNTNFDIIQTYNFACRYAICDHISDIWHKMPSYIQNECHKNIYTRLDQHILAYWKHFRENDLPNLIIRFKALVDDDNIEDTRTFDLIYDLNRSTEENMLRLSVHEGYFIATKYFWKKLTEKERQESVLKCARIVVLCYSEYEKKENKDYKKSQLVEICIFLMNQMSEDQKKDFFNEKKFPLNKFTVLHWPDIKDNILEMLLSVWPLQELFISVLKDMIQCQEDDSSMNCTFLNKITKKMVDDHNLGNSLETSKHRCLFREAWITIPAAIKQKIETSCHFRNLLNLINVWDLDSIYLILNDPAIAHVRGNLINSRPHLIESLIKDGEFEKSDQFIKKILRSDEEIKQFKQRINCWNHFSMRDRFDLLNKLLDWQSSTPEERQSLKNNIDPELCCQKIIEMYDYKLADKFLDWRFDTEEEKRNYKNVLNKDNFFLRWCIFDLWKKNNTQINKAKGPLSQFFHWFFEKEEEIALAKKKYIFEYITKGSTFKEAEVSDDLGDFLIWSILDEEQFEQIQQIKQVVAQSKVRLIKRLIENNSE